MKWHRFKIDVLGVNVAVGFPKDTKELAKEAIRLGDDPEYHDEYDVEGMYILCIKDQTHYLIFNRVYITPAVISHECFHATHGILEYVGQVFDKDNHEVYARLIEYLHEQVEKYLVISEQFNKKK